MATPAEHEQLKALTVAANNIACDFSDLVSSERVEPNLVYDVSELPHPKDAIERACKFWIQVCPDEQQRQAWKIVLPMLSQFQEGVGSPPLGIGMATLRSARNVSVEEFARRVASTRSPSPQLLSKVEAEAAALLAWVRDAVDKAQ
jgi:hypothetical protein